MFPERSEWEDLAFGRVVVFGEISCRCSSAAAVTRELQCNVDSYLLSPAAVDLLESCLIPSTATCRLPSGRYAFIPSAPAFGSEYRPPLPSSRSVHPGTLTGIESNTSKAHDYVAQGLDYSARPSRLALMGHYPRLMLPLRWSTSTWVLQTGLGAFSLDTGPNGSISCW